MIKREKRWAECSNTFPKKNQTVLLLVILFQLSSTNVKLINQSFVVSVNLFRPVALQEHHHTIQIFHRLAKPGRLISTQPMARYYGGIPVMVTIRVG